MADHPGTKIQLKPLSHVQRHSFRFVEKALLVSPLPYYQICKWGGVLTHSGEKQSIELGKHFRTAYFPHVRDEEVEVVSNQERRVAATAVKFANGFLHQTR
jgi:hypothetical protein